MCLASSRLLRLGNQPPLLLQRFHHLPRLADRYSARVGDVGLLFDTIVQGALKKTNERRTFGELLVSDFHMTAITAQFVHRPDVLTKHTTFIRGPGMADVDSEVNSRNRAASDHLRTVPVSSGKDF